MNEPLMCKREFRFVRRGQAEARTLVVGITAPFDAPTPTGETFGCVVSFLGGDESRHEVYGLDAMAAIGTALASIDTYLASMANLGELTWADGRKYQPERESAFAAARLMKDVGDIVSRHVAG